MKKIITILFLLIMILGITNIAEARSGCCSWHGGVCGCGCCDGTSLSATCAPYYPQCGYQSSPSYSSPTYSTPTCPSMSYYDSSSKNCKCYSGYIVSNNSCISGTQYCQNLYGWNSTYNTLSDKCECRYGYTVSNNSCVSNDQYCQDLYGRNAKHDSISDECECRYGYVFNKDILGRYSCVSGDSYCHDNYGYNSDYDSLSKKCECDYGYEFSGNNCIKSDTKYNPTIDYDTLSKLLDTYETKSSCPTNSTNSSDGMCYCDSGYKINDAKTGCIKVLCSNNAKISGSTCICNDGYAKDGEICYTPNNYCLRVHKENVYGEIVDGKVTCYCNNGYIWDNVNSNCIKKIVFIPEPEPNMGNNEEYMNSEKEAMKEKDENLTQRLKGRILLQVENNGQAWYVCPKDEKKYYMANGDEAYNVMRDLGVGVSNKDLKNIKADKEIAKKHSGKIFLQVESHGEAYYIDNKGGSHYLKNGESAYSVMRNLGLGITNHDLRHIEIGN